MSWVGRTLIVKRAGTTITGVRTKSLTIGNEAIDITTDDDSGWRTLLEDGSQKQIDASVEGLLKDNTLIQAAINGVAIQADTVVLPNGDTLTGNFRLNSIEVGAEYTDAVTFSAELQSSGQITFTAA